MNNEDFVTYEQAIALKKLGFREKCLYHYYYDMHNDIIPNSDTDPSLTSVNDFKISFNELEFYDEIYCDAPTLAQAQKWLRKEKKYHIDIPLINGYIAWTFGICNMSTSKSKIDCAFYNSPEEALSAGITECLKFLENIEK